MTRFGATPDTMDAMAELVAVCLKQQRDVTEEVRKLRVLLKDVKYTFGE